MRDYRTYMDRVRLSPMAHLDLMEALETGSPRRSHRRGLWAAGLAACLVLAAAIGWSLWPASDLGAALLPGSADPLPAPSAPSASAPAPEPSSYAQSYDPEALSLLVPALPEGYAFTMEGLVLPDLTGQPCVTVCYAPLAGSTTRDLTAQEMLDLFSASRPEYLALLGWEGFTLTGSCTTLPDGQLFSAAVRGSRGSSSFSLTLFPGQEPLVEEQYEHVPAFDKNGMEVTAYFLREDRDGDGGPEYHYRAHFLYGDMGVSYQSVSPDEGLSQLLLKEVLRVFTGEHGFLAFGALPAPSARAASREVTLEEAASTPMGAFLPTPPRRFTLSRAELTGETDTQCRQLTAGWAHGYDYVEVSLCLFPPHAKLPAPDFEPGDLDTEILSAWGAYVEDDAGDVPGWRYPAFTLHYSCGDSTVAATYTIKGLTPEEVARAIPAA